MPSVKEASTNQVKGTVQQQSSRATYRHEIIAILTILVSLSSLSLQ